MLRIRHLLLDICGNENTEKILVTNPQAVINDSGIEAPDPIMFSRPRKLLGLWR
ncbi:MAG: hypothetical protein ACM3TR_20985 [Caulobacteraceae bacterium]